MVFTSAQTEFASEIGHSRSAALSSTWLELFEVGIIMGYVLPDH